MHVSLSIFTSMHILCLICLHIYILAVDVREPVLEWAAKCRCLRSLNPWSWLSVMLSLNMNTALYCTRWLYFFPKGTEIFFSPYFSTGDGGPIPLQSSFCSWHRYKHPFALLVVGCFFLAVFNLLMQWITPNMVTLHKGDTFYLPCISKPCVLCFWIAV